MPNFSKIWSVKNFSRVSEPETDTPCVKSNSAKEILLFNVYQDGKLIAARLTDKHWQDIEIADQIIRHCFSVESEFFSSGNKSLHAEPMCNMGTSAQTILVTDKRVNSNLQPTTDSHFPSPVLLEWGTPKDQFTIKDITIKHAGTYAIQVLYNNRQHTIDSGVTNAVKTIAISNAKKQFMQTGIVQMPNVQDAGNSYPINSSTEFTLALDKGKYQLELGDFFNMSYLAANQTYKGNGGLAGPINKASIAGVRLVRIN